MSEWKESRLSEVATIIMGQSPQGETCNVNGEGSPLLNGPTEFGIKAPTPIQFTTDPKKKCQIGDVLFCVRGSTTGRMNWADKVYAIGRGLAAIRHKEGSEYQHFIKGLLDYHLPTMLLSATGSTFPNISGPDLNDLEIDLPPLPEQHSIASILSSLDDKIDLLHRQNKTLEALAETLFRQWFVGEGGEEVELEYVTEKITDGAHQSPPTTEIGMPMASVKDMHQWGIDFSTCRKISEPDYQKLVRDDCRPLKNDILIAKDGSYLKHIFVVPEIMDLVVLSSIAIIRPNGKYNPILLSILLKMDSTKKLLENIVTGAVIPRIVLKDFRKFPIILPPILEQNKALIIIEPIIAKCYQNIKQIRTLTRLRDTLLPKLMSGEVRVKV
jgi:type I restriction enzyme S subunit